MPTLGGPGVHGKIIKIRPYEDEGNDTLLRLTDRNRGILLAMTEYLDWKSRWETLPTPLDNEHDRIAYVDELKDRLMRMVDFCSEMINCIQNDEDTINALSLLVNSLSGTSGSLPVGENYPPSKENENLVEGTNPFCDLDILFAQCRAVIVATNGAITDILEKVEVVTNAVEFAKATWDSIPVVGAADDVVGANGVEELFNYYQEAIAEEYDAEYTVTPGGLQDELSYRLFCLCQIDCKITINRIWNFLHDRVAVFLSPPSFEGLINVFEFMFGVEQDSSTVVDINFFVAWSLLRYGNMLYGQRFDGFLPLILKLTADEPSNDWVALSEVFGDCPTYSAQVVGIIGNCGHEVYQFVEYELGVPFDVDAVDDALYPGNWSLPLKLPGGVWEVTVNSITGTIIVPEDPTQTAYAWFDEFATYHNVLWNAPASPDEFGTKVVADNGYAPWCTTQRWDIALFNDGPFSANITVNVAP